MQTLTQSGKTEYKISCAFRGMIRKEMYGIKSYFYDKDEMLEACEQYKTKYGFTSFMVRTTIYEDVD